MEFPVKLIDEAKTAWTMLSVQIMTLGAASSSTYAVMYDQLKEYIPAPLMVKVTAAMFVFGIVGRLIKQGEAMQAQKGGANDENTHA